MTAFRYRSGEDADRIQYDADNGRRTHPPDYLDDLYKTWGSDALVHAALLKDIRGLLEVLVKKQ